MSQAWPFVLEQALGAGTGGVIRAAIHRPSGSRVALKTVQTESPRAAFLLDRELAALARTRHPYILGLYDHGVAREEDPVETGVAWLALELASGGALEDWVPTAWGEVLATALHVLDGLAHAHARGLVHRDLKPSNLLMCTAADLRPGVKIADFGLAWAVHDDRRGVRRGGTPDYIAPEQVRGDALAFGPWTDLYAFGAMLWQWATGHPPFRHDEVAAQCEAHLSEPVPAFVPTMALPAGLEPLLRRLLAKGWQDRPVCAAVVAEQLRSLHRGPVSPAPRYPLAVAREGLVFESAPPALPGAGLSLLGRRELGTVGRRAERAALWRHLADAVEGRRTVVVAVVGESGSGCRHVARWLVRRVVELGVAEGHWIDEETGLAGFVERALGVVARSGDELRPGAGPLDEELYRHRASARVLRVLRWLVARAERVPQVVWVPAAAAPALELLVEALLQGRSVPLLLVATGRPDDTLWHELEPQAGYHRVALERLPHQDLLDLGRLELGLSHATSQQMVGQVQGRPGALVRWVRLLAAEGRLAASPEGFTVEGGVGAPVPLDDAERARFLHTWSWLGPSGRLAVRVGAVLGERVVMEEWHATLAALDETPDEVALRRLWKDGWIRRSASSWGFHEAWVRHLVLEPLPEAVTRALHRSAAEALGRLHPGLDRMARRVGHLLAAGRQEQEALQVLRVVLPRAKEQQRWGLVEHLCDQMARHLAVDELGPDDRFLLVYYRFEARRLQAGAEAVADRLDELVALLPEVSEGLADHLVWALVEVYALAGQPEEAERLLRTLGIDEPRSWRVRGMICLERGQLDEGRVWLTRAFEGSHGLFRAGVANALGRAEGLAGDEEASIAWFQEAARYVPAVQRAVPFLNLAIGSFKGGRHAQAVAYGREALGWMDALALAHRVHGAVFLAVIAAGANERALFQRVVDYALYALRTPQRVSADVVLELVGLAEQTAEPEFLSFLDDTRRKLGGTGRSRPGDVEA